MGRNLETGYWTHSDGPKGAVARNLDWVAPDEHSITFLPHYGAATALAPGGSPCYRAPTRNRLPLVMMTGIFDDHYETDCLNMRAETATSEAFIGLRLTPATPAYGEGRPSPAKRLPSMIMTGRPDAH
jgi:hypothetical protein